MLRSLRGLPPEAEQRLYEASAARAEELGVPAPLAARVRAKPNHKAVTVCGARITGAPRLLVLTAKELEKVVRDRHVIVEPLLTTEQRRQDEEENLIPCDRCGERFEVQESDPRGLDKMLTCWECAPLPSPLLLPAELDEIERALGVAA